MTVTNSALSDITPVCNLVNLKTLILGDPWGGNPLKKLPDDISNMTALENLQVPKCQLEGALIVSYQSDIKFALGSQTSPQFAAL